MNKASAHVNVYAIRLASPADAETLVQVGISTFYDTFAHENTVENMKLYLEKTFTLDQISKDLNDPNYIFILVYDREDVAGYAKLRKGEVGSGGKIEIERLYATKDYIGKRVGKTLMQTCIELATSLGYTAVHLGVWEHNTRAISFYEQWGFRKVGTHPFLLGSDLQTDLMMEKLLDKR